MMISVLPPELLEEILSRVPATSLKRLGSTCKRWNALFKDRNFTAKQFRNAPKESMVLTLTGYKVIPMRVNNLNAIPPFLEFKGAHGQKNSHFNSEKADFFRVFHCNGLLLCTTVDLRLMVWNPCLGEPVWIEFDTLEDRYSLFALGYGKNASGLNYKIFMLADSQKDRSKIYEFSSDSWKVLDDVVLDDYMLTNIYVSLKGNTYWLAYDKKKMCKILLSFDFTVERFKSFGLPENHSHKMALSVVGEKQLLLLSESYASSTSKMVVWVINEIDSDVETALKWNISLTFDIPITISSGYCWEVLVSHLTEEEKKMVVYSFGEVNKVYVIGENDDSYREICVEPKYQGWWWGSRIINYVPTLVQVQKGA